MFFFYYKTHGSFQEYLFREIRQNIKFFFLFTFSQHNQQPICLLLCLFSRLKERAMLLPLFIFVWRFIFQKHNLPWVVTTYVPIGVVDDTVLVVPFKQLQIALLYSLYLKIHIKCIHNIFNSLRPFHKAKNDHKVIRRTSSTL